MKVYFFKTVLLDNFLDVPLPAWILILVGFIWAIYQTNENEKKRLNKNLTLKETREEYKIRRIKEIDIARERIKKEIKLREKKRYDERVRQSALEKKIIRFLNTEESKLPASDIDFRLSLNDIDKTKSTLKKLYKSGRVGRTSNYRYFTKTSKDRKTQPVTKTSTKDPEKELIKLKSLLDKDLITKDDYNLKKKQLLGI